MVNKEKARRKSKAISPIIATLILIVIAVVAGVMLYGFVTGFMAKTTSNTGTFSGSALTIQGASISRSVSHGITTYTITAVVTNTGSSPTNVTAVNVLYASNSSLIGTGSISGVNTPSGHLTAINASQTVQITAQLQSNSLTSTPASGTPVIVQVVTRGGGYTDYQTTWP
ncbi:MAG: archaellin/type IV pilin N-terminal domain-containing protein [Conexivisphaera sp.]